MDIWLQSVSGNFVLMTSARSFPMSGDHVRTGYRAKTEFRVAQIFRPEQSLRPTNQLLTKVTNDDRELFFLS
jgi:hypothetical protein